MNIKNIINNKKINEVESRVLTYIIEHIDDVMNMGVRGIAKNNYTSTSVIMRLTKKLGYTGFVDMRYKLYPQIKSNMLLTSLDIDSEKNDLFSTAHLKQFNDEHLLSSFAKKLTQLDDKFFFIYATGFSAIIAEYIHKKLLVLGKKSMLASGSDSAAVFENNLNHIGIFLAVSKSGHTEQVLNKARIARENGIFVVSFTNELLNPLAELSNINFKIEDNNKIDDLNILPNLFFPNLLILFEAITYKYHKMLIIKK
ncbi:MurR/RpiR family transcriptional regulator [Orbus sturtevantii]|uniref:MurR/RpiR family transcriptional regulator n=1 Tax=Orbus sturtevantii TaxID=3074109 RepID=UPI00370DCBFE